MPERPRPQEEQKPPMVLAVEAAKEFQEKLEESSEFKSAVSQISKKLGSGKEAHEHATNMVKGGVGMAMQRIGLLPAFANVEKRAEILEEIKKNQKEEAPWIDILASWDVNSDPNGFGVLEACKQKDIQGIRAKMNEAENEQQKSQLQIQIDAISKGQDLIITHYKKRIKNPPSKIAA